ncbi:hypothetical protein NX773_18375 [Massilia solisilvae]|uniref:Uncharacterized protein n=1 Tax=Massilia solisilvae TaxID=1811225 RepID=A0ABT2BNQ2_9BURK|nr:hypothetical protein [Massilia solisilvae]MCS0610137.1 hypothetical protein [Massilia solisilvae]
MNIHGLYYFNAKGEVGYFDTPDDPYFLGPNKSALALSLFNTNRGVGWYFFRHQGDEGEVKIAFDKGCRAIYDATRTRVVAVGRQEPLIVWLTNAAVFAEDGKLDHVIDLPNYVEHSFDGKMTEQYPAEGFAFVESRKGKIALGVYFCFQWVQTRLYDPFARQWGEVIGVGRS